MVLYGVKLCDWVFYILTMRVGISSGAVFLSKHTHHFMSQKTINFTVVLDFLILQVE